MKNLVKKYNENKDLLSIEEQIQVLEYQLKILNPEASEMVSRKVKEYEIILKDLYKSLIKVIKVEDLKQGDIILSESYTIQASIIGNGNTFHGTKKHTYSTEMEVMRIRDLDDEVAITMCNKAHVTKKYYKKGTLIVIK